MLRCGWNKCNQIIVICVCVAIVLNLGSLLQLMDLRAAPATQRVVAATIATTADATVTNISIANATATGGNGQTSLNFFILLHERASLVSRWPLMTIESVCKHHPAASFHVYILPNTTASLDDLVVDGIAEYGCQIKQYEYDVSSLILGTPLESSILLHDSVSALFGIVVLWKFGGWYLGIDELILRPLSNLTNCITKYSNYAVQSAIFQFDQGHPFLKEVMSEIKMPMTGSNAKGGHAVDAAFGSIVDSWPFKNCSFWQCVLILDETQFYPLGPDINAFSTPFVSKAGLVANTK